MKTVVFRAKSVYLDIFFYYSKPSVLHRFRSVLYNNLTLKFNLKLLGMRTCCLLNYHWRRMLNVLFLSPWSPALSLPSSMHHRILTVEHSHPLNGALPYEACYFLTAYRLECRRKSQNVKHKNTWFDSFFICFFDIPVVVLYRLTSDVT